MKLILHRASMKSFEERYQKFDIHYISNEKNNTLEKLFKIIKENRIREIKLTEILDIKLEKLLIKLAKKNNIEINISGSPGFLTDLQWIREYFSNNNFKMTSFYIAQRKRLGILVDNGKPTGGKWSFDAENREKLPKNLPIPEPLSLKYGDHLSEAVEYVESKFKGNPGELSGFNWPIDSFQAERVLSDFLKNRLKYFGNYQDYISKDSYSLFHSLLSSSLNIGLINPNIVLDEVLSHHKRDPVPLNCLEGFLRQLIGWREYVRAVYIIKYSEMTKGNFWGHKKPIPSSFYNANTGLKPLDDSLEKVKRRAYVHHIERLMILGNFCLLTKIDPDAVYNWFMEMFIDSYEWVMVPNVYGMSQYADGGSITTKPYISSSNYIRNMSEYGKGDWSSLWDSLFWNFIDENKEKIYEIPRMRVIIYNLDRIPGDKIAEYKNQAKVFMDNL